MMDKVCQVVAGNWNCGSKGEWDFVIDKGRFGRLVTISETCTLEELCLKICLLFQAEKMQASVSYWNNGYGDSALGKKMPPFLIETDCGVRKLFTEKSDMNLFVTFKAKEDLGSFKTPVMENKRKSPVFEGESSVVVRKKSAQTGKSKGLRQKTGVVYVDEEFLDEVDGHIQSAVKSVGGHILSAGKSVGDSCGVISLKNGDEPNWNLFGTDDMSEVVENEDEEEDVIFGGYDTEFWEPLVDDIYGGTNVAELVCGMDEDDSSSGKTENEAGMNEENISPQFCVQSTGKVNGKPEKKQNSVDASEEDFDVSPLFDDTIYERSEIPDLDRDAEEEVLYVGKTFGSKLDCQIALAIHAIKNMFYFKQTRSQKNYIVVNCGDSLCGWKVTAYEMKDSCYYAITKASLDHTCSIETRCQFTKLASAKVIAAIYKSKFSDREAGPKPLDLQQLLLEELRLSSSYSKCWRAREAANVDNQGSEVEGYLNLLQYLHMLKLANPGTIADVKTEDNGCGGERFLYLFLSFGASKVGFRSVRPVLVIDGAHLGGKYKGVLLTASGQDANFQVFPLAFAIVDSENDASWKWFLEKVEGIIADSPRVTIISDRATCIKTAVRTVFPLAKHGACIVHLSRNVVTKFKSKGLAKMVTAAASAYQLGKFNKLFGKIEGSSSECARYLERCGLENWTRVYFPGDRYNMMTSNIAESLNNAVRKARNSPITDLVMFIQSMLGRWFGARREKAEKHRGDVTPQVDKVITGNLKFAKGSSVIAIAGGQFEVRGEFGFRNNVDLKDKKCTCKFYDRIQIPCGHALLASGVMGVSYAQVTGDYYRTTAWRQTYKGIIQPAEDPKDGDIPEEIRSRFIGPPRTRRPPGRPKQKRIPSIGEISDGGSNKGSTNRCTRCRGVGHNKTSCKRPI